MKAEAVTLLDLLRISKQFVIPVYQRNYSWESKQCEKLWADIIRAGTNDKVKAHFIGAITYIERDLTVVNQQPSLVIDGQQRLTTCTLLIAALANYFEENQLPELLGAFSAKKLRNNYLINPDEEDDRRYKLLLSETDKNTLLAILQTDLPKPDTSSERINENYNFFQNKISSASNQLEVICRGLDKLKIVAIALERTQDDPQMIFESMNFTGLRLKQSDLIRNYILMDLDSKEQTALYKDYWRPMEEGFGQEAYKKHFDPFMRCYLIVKKGKIPKMDEIYDDFKEYARYTDIKKLVSDIKTFANYYCAMILDAETDKKLKKAFQDLKELKVDVAYPFLLDAYEQYKQNKLTVDELVEIVRLVESYVFRRAICDIPTNSLNKIFATFSQSLENRDRYLESVKTAFLKDVFQSNSESASSYRGFPSDKQFQNSLKTRDLYHSHNCSYLLRRLENHKRKEPVAIKDYTIEHVMPQNEELPEEWRTELGSNWKQVHQSLLHTLGNLTLTGYNPEYSDKSFLIKQKEALDKQNKKISFDSSPLRLNAWEFDIDKQKFSLATIPTWNEAAIQARAESLALAATEIWSIPKLDPGVLETYSN